MVTCEKCGKQGVGSTINLFQRISNYLSHIQSKYNEGAIAAHFLRGIVIVRASGLTQCKVLQEGTKFRSNSTKETFKIRENINCRSNNIIYLVTCEKCGKQGVGSTINLFQRISNYLSHIQSKYNEGAIAAHFFRGIVIVRASGLTQCKVLQEGTKFRSNSTKETFKIRENINCRSNNIIYLVTCEKCGKQGVGSTINLFQRISNYLSHIQSKYNEGAIAAHFFRGIVIYMTLE